MSENSKSIFEEWLKQLDVDNQRLLRAEKKMLDNTVKKIGAQSTTGKVWTVIYIESGHWVWLTNDDKMIDKPNGYICITQGFGPSEEMEALPKWGNIPIVFFATIDKKGIPDFKVTDEEKRMRCAVAWAGRPLAAL